MYTESVLSHGLNHAYMQVRKFHEAFDHPVSNTPRMLTPEEAALRHKLLTEEVNELLEAKTLVDQVDASMDAIYIALGNLVIQGVLPQAMFDCIQYANMSKLGPDGKPIKREDGKIMKPEGWTPPEAMMEQWLAKQKSIDSNE